MGRDQKKRSRAAEGKGGSDGVGGGDGDDAGQRKKERETKGKDVESTEMVASSPTEEEFNEFFAILRRMKEAVKYYGKSSGGVEMKKTEETPSPSPSPSGVVDDVQLSRKKRDDDAVLDLNSVPEGESSSCLK